MRPTIRRHQRSDLDQARRLVSAAEREALGRAEELGRQAERLLAEVSGAGCDELAAQVAALQTEMEAARARADLQAEELGRLRADQHQTGRRLDRLQAAVEAVRPGADAPADCHAEDAGDRQADDAGDAVLAAAREAEELLGAAMVAMDREMARSQSMRAEAESVLAAARADADRIRAAAAAEAASILDSARADAQAIRRQARDEGRADGRSSLDDARRRLAEETAGLRIAMDQTWATLEKLIGGPELRGGGL